MGNNLFNLQLDEVKLAKLIEESIERVLNRRLPPPPPKFYTFKELSTLLSCSRVTLHTLKNNGSLEFFRMNGARRPLVSQEQLDKFLLQNPGFSELGEVHGSDQPPVRRRRKTRRQLLK